MAHIGVHMVWFACAHMVFSLQRSTLYLFTLCLDWNHSDGALLLYPVSLSMNEYVYNHVWYAYVIFQVRGVAYIWLVIRDHCHTVYIGDW